MFKKTKVTMNTCGVLVFVTLWASFAAQPVLGVDITVEVLLESEEMWNMVDNYGDQIELDLQDKYSENANAQYSRLVVSVDQEALDNETVSLLDKLIDAYQVDESDTEEINDFLKEIFDTDVIKRLRTYLNDSGEVDDPDFEDEFKRIWFEYYQLQDDEKMTGFQRVFMGEFNDTEIMGLNNWVRYYKEEADNAITYQGWSDKTTLNKVNLVEVIFLWNGNVSEAISTIPFGTKPEYELAIYTLCWYKLPGDECLVYMGENDRAVNIVTEAITYEDKEYVRFAYMEIMGGEDTGASSSLRPYTMLTSVICVSIFFQHLFAL